MKHQSVKILDTTLRDGSYAIDFQFTAQDTAFISSILDQSGIPFIEIGHGLGLNAGAAGRGVPGATDEEYLAAAAKVVSRGRFGMFCIPGIARLKDMELGRKHGMHFIRIGVNITEMEQAEPFLKRAKDLGYEYIFCNLMKSYTAPPEIFAAHAAKAAAWGADVVVLVDSAGGMLPDDIRRYLEEASNRSQVLLGFHGHNNLSLAVANSIESVRSGAVVVDTSLQGLGRSAGNAATEVVVAVLKRQGHELGVDERLLQNGGEHLIRPLLGAKGWEPISITSGYALFHSSHLKTVKQYAEQFGLDQRDLILSLCERDKVEAPKELVEELARRLADLKKTNPRKPVSLSLPGHEAAIHDENLFFQTNYLAKRLRNRALKTKLKSVLNIKIPIKPALSTQISRFIQEGFGFIIGSIEPVSEQDLVEILKAVDGLVDGVLIDTENKAYDGLAFARVAAATLTKTPVLHYIHSEVWSRAVRNLILSLKRTVDGVQTVVVGDNFAALRLVRTLAELGARVFWLGPDHGSTARSALSEYKVSSPHQVSFDPKGLLDAEVLVGLEHREPVIQPDMISSLAGKAMVIDGGIGSLASGVVEICDRKGIQVYRVDLRPALAGEIVPIFGAHYLIAHTAGRKDIGGVTVVAGGKIGQPGDIVLDSISNPSVVIGVADGTGGVQRTIPSDKIDDVNRVQREIIHNKLL